MEPAYCNALKSLDAFDSYMELLRKETGFQQPRLKPCRQKVCLAIWGNSNPDISGIGVC